MTRTRDAHSEIGAETTCRGRVRTAGDLRIAGRLEGSLEVQGTLVIEDRGVVKADIQGASATVHGIVVGNIQCSEQLELGPTARVLGDLSAPKLSIADGAKVSGLLEIGAVARPRATMTHRPEADRPRREEVELITTRPAEAQQAAHRPARGPDPGPPIERAQPEPGAHEEKRKRVVVKKRGQ